MQVGEEARLVPEATAQAELLATVNSEGKTILSLPAEVRASLMVMEKVYEVTVLIVVAAAVVELVTLPGEAVMVCVLVILG